jgi:hypothetical protein
MIGRRFFAIAPDAERDLIAYWQMVKLLEEALGEPWRCLTPAELRGTASRPVVG